MPAQTQAAVAQLADAPAEQRERIVRGLTSSDATVPAVRLAAELVLGWGDPAQAWSIFEATLGLPSVETPYALRRFADLAGAAGTPPAWRVRALALSRLAALVPEPAAGRARADAARAFLQAGDAASARIELERVATDGAAPADAQRLAAATLISALIHERKLDSAAVRLRGAGIGLSQEDRAALGADLAWARIRQGQLDLADSALASDSGLEALALRGWIALYRGQLQDARARFLAAGPYAGGSREATERTAMVALLERLPQRRFPELGAALLTLARGDSAAAVTALRQAADQLTADLGRGDALYVAGRICERLGPQGEETAAVLFEDVVRSGGAGAAPAAAELAWAACSLRPGASPTAVALRAPDTRHIRERGGARSAPGARAGEGSDSEIVKRREFVKAVGANALGLAMPLTVLDRLRPTSTALSLLIPMDDSQSDHLKAYGVTYRVIQSGVQAEWLLNYRGGSFLVPDGVELRRDAGLTGARVEPVTPDAVMAIRGEIGVTNADSVPLEKPPKVAVYVPPNTPRGTTR